MAAFAESQLDIAGALNTIRQKAGGISHDLAQATATGAQAIVRVRSGNLQSHIGVQDIDETSSAAVAGTAYAQRIERLQAFLAPAAQAAVTSLPSIVQNHQL